MKKSVIFLAALGVAFSSAQAAGNSYVARALIVDTQPIIETVYEDVEVCRYTTKTAKSISNNTQDKVIGGLIGGAAGTAIGNGSGRDAAAGIGAVLGSEIADGDELTSGELIGGVAGALIGNQVGKGKGKSAATAAGALIGSIVGDNIQNGGSATATTTKKVKVCEVRQEPKKVITGYTVEFEHDGYRFTDVLKKRPQGNYLDISVDVDVVEDYTSRVE